MQNEIRQFIDNQKWTFAQTYAKTAPHEYIVRDHLSENEKNLFDKFATLIKKEGYEKNFYDQLFTYYNIEEKRYWVMDNIINRDDVNNDYEKDIIN